MKWTTIFRFFISIILAHSNVSYSQTSDEIMLLVNDNISNGNIEENLDVYEDLDSKNYFDSIDCSERSRIFHKIGVSLYLKDENLEAANFYKSKVLPSWEECEKKPILEYANSLYNTGVSLQYADKYQEAKLYFHESIELFESDTSYSRLKLSSKYAGIARFYKDAQSYIRAVNYYETAIQIISSIDKNSSRAGRYKQDLGIALNEMGQYDRAIPYFKNTIDIFKNHNDQRRLAMAYQNIAISYLESDDVDSSHYSLDSAQYFINKSLNLHEGNESFLSNDYEIMGLIYKKRNERTKSQHYLTRSLNLRKEESGNRRSVASSFENLAELSKDVDLSEARRLIDSAINSLVLSSQQNSFGNPIIKDIISLNDVSVIRAMGIKANLYSQDIKIENDRNVALDLYKKIDSLFAINIFNLHFEKSRLSYFQLLFNEYSDAVDYCVQLHQESPHSGYDQLAFSYATKTKSLVLLNEIKENEWYSENVRPALEEEKNQAQIKVRNLFSQIIESTDGSNKLNSDYLKAQRNLELVLAKIDSTRGRNRNDIYSLNRQIGVGEIQQGLGGDHLYIEYFLSKNNLYSFLITKDTFNLIIHDNLSMIANLSHKLQSQIEDRTSKVTDINETRNKLSKLLLPNIVKRGEGLIKNWTVVPDGFLHKISFDLLNCSDDSNKYLIEDVVLSIAYSSEKLAQNKVARLGNSYLGFGTTYTPSLKDEDFSDRTEKGPITFGQLQLAESEISSCSQIMNGRSYLGEKSTKETFKSEWPFGDVIHLSLHGYVDENFYDKSFLIFDDRQEENILFLPELIPSTDRVQLIVLSSCYTAAGQLFKGDGIQGLTKAFMKSGKATVISSLWEASDLSASQIVPSFFTNLKRGNNVASSLNKAKLEYLKNALPSQKHPYYWANFQIVGQGNLSLSNYNYLWLIGVIALLLFSFFIIKKSYLFR